jgi:methionyl-tRNA formyltransferase
MFNTVILLTGKAEQSPLASILRRHNPALNIHAATTAADLDILAPRDLKRARLIGFATPVIVPKWILDELGFGAYNFHPGPPHYPGWLPAHFAIYDRATEFGATAHVMVEKVDTGPIVGVELFAIPPQASVAQLEQRAYVEIARLFWRLAPALATQTEPLEALPVQWRGRKSTRRIVQTTCDIPIDISAHELDCRIDAFGAGIFGIAPTVTIHGRTFRYVPQEAAAVPMPERKSA